VVLEERCPSGAGGVATSTGGDEGRTVLGSPAAATCATDWGGLAAGSGAEGWWW
jgi:hypothetical protein